jgi:hypothetical protein
MKKRMCLLGLFVVVVCAFIAVPLLQAVEKDVEMEAIDRENGRVRDIDFQFELMQAVLDAVGPSSTSWIAIRMAAAAAVDGLQPCA